MWDDLGVLDPFAAIELSSLEPLEGGWSGRTFRGRVGESSVVVRIHPPNDPPHVLAPHTLEAVHRWVRGLVRVPGVLEVMAPDAAADLPGLLVTEFVDGVRGDLAFDAVVPMDADALLRAGRDLGAVAGTLSGIATLQAGLFTSPELGAEPFEQADALTFVESQEHRLVGWSEDALTDLRYLAGDAQAILDEAGRTCLVHGDLNPKNVILDPTTGAVRAVLDWEFAHSGHPMADLGNLLRFERRPEHVESILAGYLEAAPGSGSGADVAATLEAAHAADLVALVELATRLGQNPVAARADELLRAMVASSDLAAVPG